MTQPWRLVRLPAIAVKDEGWRKEGEPLWPERWPLSELEPLRDADLETWLASYQQEPAVAGGYWFKDIVLNYYEEAHHRDFNVYMLCDPALRKHKKADFTTIYVFGTGGDRNFYWLDLVRERLSPSERADHFFRLHRKWRPLGVGYEEYGLQSDIVTLRDRMERENYRFVITELGRSGDWHNLSKDDRVRTLIPLGSSGRIWLPNPETKGRDAKVVELVRYFVAEEWSKYPACKYDDVLDVMSRMMDPAMNVQFPRPRVEEPRPETRRTGTSYMSL